jgi:hypothetical protein
MDPQRMDPRSHHRSRKDDLSCKRVHRTSVHRSEQQAGLGSGKTAIKLHRSGQQNKTQKYNGAPYVLCQSQE